MVLVGICLLLVRVVMVFVELILIVVIFLLNWNVIVRLCRWNFSVLMILGL